MKVLAAGAIAAGSMGMAVLGLGFSRGWFIQGGGGFCSSPGRLTPAPVAEQLLSTHPEGVREKESEYSGCDGDDEYVYVGRSYVLTDDGADVLSFYREVSSRDGWRTVDVGEGSSTSDGQSLCLTKAITGGAAFASIKSPDVAGNRAGSEYDVTVSAVRGEWSADGGVLC
ncbi:hypothetical protein GCM10023074_48030 [Microbispora amethystogenes]|uniref:Secreted protein n=1 Tax=Microbispora amethystogenes TaxID=1427754 RepID=A0ABQ4FFV1_9ACTN|nr:hypothetical protein Mam01_38740 [Microbispora amethystogenes]